ncbi:Uncharacterized protein ycf37 [Monoraphidium neglectum]|uniref:Uncharacterized protein ycf37 n=1 Tax=Monoraphidium neglectum TaxID=145388 RepID=A0A0D2JN01_9CHLO|nr:Uncharacterized protein ycf37 [Monoraphidium neglectum]KIZ00543.1 Uncharacterized protein ycf37 [Monoraphidium neglectum]|eukprot:XP_013899562.1 Uncharacterized protein ycf37 [Monoraphidium neglectum]
MCPVARAAAAAVVVNGSWASDSSSVAAAAAMTSPQLLFQVSEGLEAPIQLIYLLSLLGFLSVGAYLVVRQVLIRRELDEAAKALGERIRTGQASCEVRPRSLTARPGTGLSSSRRPRLALALSGGDYYELGVILTRKKLYTQATKNLEKAKRVWDGDEAELAQVHNALGFCYFQMAKNEQAIGEYEKAVQLQAGYVTAWNNLGDAYESTKQWRKALEAYQTVLQYAPNNKVASTRGEYCKGRVERLGL